jgi:hypothetical protein
MLSEFDRRHIPDLLTGHGSWFTAHLLRLCAKADEQNLARLAEAFPNEVDAYLDWRSGRGYYAEAS